MLWVFAAADFKVIVTFLMRIMSRTAKTQFNPIRIKTEQNPALHLYNPHLKSVTFLARKNSRMNIPLDLI